LTHKKQEKKKGKEGRRREDASSSSVATSAKRAIKKRDILTKIIIMLDVRLLLLPLSILVAIASCQLTIENLPPILLNNTLDNEVQNSQNAFKPIKKNSGNLFQNQYKIKIRQPQSELSQALEVINKLIARGDLADSSSSKTSIGFDLNVELIGQLLATSLLTFILLFLVADYARRTG